MEKKGLGQSVSQEAIQKVTINSNNPTLPVPAQQPQNLPLTHRVFARKLQHTSLVTIRQLSARREF